MTTLTTFAAKNPDKPALIYGPLHEGGTERIETYGELEERSRRIGVLLRNLGLEAGDCVAVLMANDDEFMDVFWAAHRIGLYFTPVNWHLQVDEVEYIVDNCDAKVLVAHQRFGEIAAKATASNSRLVERICVGGETRPYISLGRCLIRWRVTNRPTWNCLQIGKSRVVRVRRFINMRKKEEILKRVIDSRSQVTLDVMTLEVLIDIRDVPDKERD